MTFTKDELKARQALLLDDDAPDGAILPSDDLVLRDDVLDFVTEYVDEAVAGIPEGPEGPQGVQGPAGVPGPVGPAGLNWRGAWAAGTTYALNDAVGHGGASYFNILAITGNAGNANPVFDTTHWALMAAQGAQGMQGLAGARGAQGPVGPVGPAGPAGLLAYKSFAALLSAAGGALAPLCTVLENGLGSFSLSRLYAGFYTITINNAFVNGKTLIPTQGYIQSLGGGYEIRVQRENQSVISVETLINGVNSDDVLFNFSLEIRVYN